MILPENGRIIIIDDQIDQALPLINYLSKNGLPFKYFSGNQEELPLKGEGFDDIRIIFLDLNLLDNKIPDKSHFSQLKGVLNRIVNSVCHPYLLVVWTRHDDKISDLESYVFDETGGMDKKKPFHIMKADKISFFDLDGTRVDTGDYNNLKKFLEDELSNFSELECLYKWENHIHNITNQIASEFFPPEVNYKDWAIKTRGLLNIFAKASIGRHYSTSDDTTKVNAAFEVINQLFMDKLETSFYSLTHNLDLTQDDNGLVLSKLEINSKLLTGTPIKKDARYPGTVVLCENDRFKKIIFDKIILRDPSENFFQHNELIADFVDLVDEKRTALIDEYYKKNKININELNGDQIKSAKQDAVANLKQINHNVNFNDLNKRVQKQTCRQKKDSLFSDAILIEVCIDPLCDYVQQKAFFPKIAKGLIVRSEMKELIDVNTEALYISPDFIYADKEVFLVLDYRYLQTLNENNSIEYSNLNTPFRLRSTLLADIQSKFSRHVNRQGILFL
ncbi:hypothetical protein [Acinetobacter sp. CWB-B33]|uniref:hypothetical protein n=1 Tax=Acinetobacter sp. CWB-B33 TaxID=2815724 RepID=UPI0031FEB587